MMIPFDPHKAEDRTLWQHARAAVWRDGRCPDELTLAGFADGRLPGPQRLAIEAHLSDCADCREAVDAARELAATTPPAVDEGVIERAQALVESASVPVADADAAAGWDDAVKQYDGPAVIGRTRPAPLVGGVGLAAAVVLCATAGFMVGKGMAVETSPRPPQSVAADTGVDPERAEDLATLDPGWVLKDAFDPAEDSELVLLESLEWLLEPGMEERQR